MLPSQVNVTFVAWQSAFAELTLAVDWHWDSIWTNKQCRQIKERHHVNCISVLEFQCTSSCCDVTYVRDDDAAQLGPFREVVVLKGVTARWVSDRESTLSWNSDDWIEQNNLVINVEHVNYCIIMSCACGGKKTLRARELRNLIFLLLELRVSL